MSNLDTVRTMLACFSAGDPAGQLEHCTDDVVYLLAEDVGRRRTQLVRYEGMRLGLEVAIPVAKEAVAAEVAILQPAFQPDIADAEARLEP